MSKVAAAAIEAAVNGEEPRRRRLSGLRAVAAGAALATGARLVVAKAPNLPKVPDFRGVTDGVRDRLAERGWIEDERPDEFEDEEYEEDEDEEPEDEEPEDEEPQDEAEPEDQAEPEDEEEPDDDEWDDDGDDDEGGDDDPQAAGDEDLEDEGDDDGDDESDEEDEEDSSPPPVEIGANGGGRRPARGAAELPRTRCSSSTGRSATCTASARPRSPRPWQRTAPTSASN